MPDVTFIFDRDDFMRTPIFNARPIEIEPSFLYVMRCEHFIKIGIASDVLRRLAGLQGANPFPVSLAKKFSFRDRQYAWLAEQTCHKVFSSRRAFGEWFSVDYAVAAPFVASVVSATRHLMPIHGRAEQERRRAREADPKWKAKMDADYADFLERHKLRQAREVAKQNAARAFDEENGYRVPY